MLLEFQSANIVPRTGTVPWARECEPVLVSISGDVQMNGMVSHQLLPEPPCFVYLAHVLSEKDANLETS